MRTMLSGENQTNIPIIIVDYLSAKRTIQFINESRNFFRGFNPIYVVIDNSCNQENYEKLIVFFNCFRAETNNPNLDQVHINEEENIFVLKACKNNGFAKANNIAYLYIKNFYSFEYVVFSNNDIQFIENNDCSKLITTLNSHKNVGLIGPRIIGLDGRQQSPNKYINLYDRWVKFQLLWPMTRFLNGLSTNDIICIDYSDYVYRIIGAFMLVNCDAFEKADLFDENTFLYAEEPILSERLNAVGYRVYYQNDVELIHEGGFTTGSSRSSQLTKKKRQFHSEIYYYKKYRNESLFALGLAKISFGLFCMKYRIACLLRREE